MKIWTDTHAHIYLDDFAEDRQEMLDRALRAGVEKIYMPNIDHRSVDDMLNVEAKNSGRCHAMMGLHPCSVKDDFEKELYVVETWLSKRAFSAVGEMGTDLYWDKTFWEQQKEAFIIQAAWAQRYQLPLVIHCRESMNQTIELLQPLCNSGLRGIFHCFTGDVMQANKIVELGFYLGIGGVSTFRNGGLDKVLLGLSLDKIVLETDSPYLAPVPHRGKRNEPGYVPIIAEKVAALMSVTLEELQQVSTENATRLFSPEKVSSSAPL